MRWLRVVAVPALLLCSCVLLAQSQPTPSPAQAASQSSPQAAPAPPPTATAKQDDRPILQTHAATGQLVLNSGTKLPLVMENAVTTRNAHPGDPVYFETIFPIVQQGKILIPAGSYVYGEVVEAKRPGRVKGRAELLVRMNMLILPNAYAVNFNAAPTNAGTGGNESMGKEGTIKGDSDKGNDAATIVGTTLAGAGVGSAIGSAAGNAGKGAVMGLGAGAVAGLLATLLSRGPEIDLPRGTTVDVELAQPLYLDAAQINFTDPGHASDLSGPPNRQPVRSNRFPF